MSGNTNQQPNDSGDSRESTPRPVDRRLRLASSSSSEENEPEEHVRVSEQIQNDQNLNGQLDSEVEARRRLDLNAQLNDVVNARFTATVNAQFNTFSNSPAEFLNRLAQVGQPAAMNHGQHRISTAEEAPTASSSAESRVGAESPSVHQPVEHGMSGDLAMREEEMSSSPSSSSGLSSVAPIRAEVEVLRRLLDNGGEDAGRIGLFDVNEVFNASGRSSSSSSFSSTSTRYQTTPSSAGQSSSSFSSTGLLEIMDRFRDDIQQNIQPARNFRNINRPRESSTGTLYSHSSEVTSEEGEGEEVFDQ